MAALDAYFRTDLGAETKNNNSGAEYPIGNSLKTPPEKSSLLTIKTNRADD